MTKLEIVKNGAKLIVGVSTSYVVANVIKNNTTPNTQLQKVEVLIAAAIIGNLVAQHTEKSITDSIDRIATTWKDAVSKTQK